MVGVSSIQRVGILTNPTKPNADELRQELCEWLEKRGTQVLDALKVPIEKIVSEADLFICLGGDGTILHLAGRMIDRMIPVLGVNIGSLGFLTEVRVEELYDELKLIFSGQCQIEERMLLSASVRWENARAGTEKERRFQALNDIVINREGLTRYMAIQIDIGGERATRFFGDGVIVATPTGSTAYSLSAGGPIVHPSLDHIIITPICPHASALRPLVVSGKEPVRIRITCNEAREKALLTADGQTDVPIDNQSVVEVTRSISHFRLVKSSKRSYYATLREKFKLPE
ncbi:MAG: NAD(+)/NADH kinase [Candidatus Omnitrophica bacterium]|nr:NAD(+)/NADH kinase [Candidatus Omnitrophota bacterium]